MKADVSIWALPSSDDAEYLARIIARLATRYNTPVFTPHITLVGPISVELSDITARLSECTQEFSPLSVRVTSIEHSPRRFEAVTARMEYNNNLIALRQWICALNIPEAIEPDYRPHISLLYGELAQAERESLVLEIRLKNVFRFSSVALVSPGSSRDWTNVSEWQTLHTWTLGTQ